MSRPQEPSKLREEAVFGSEVGQKTPDVRADGESWQDYAHRLEHRIQEQKAAMRELQAVREPGDKVARRKIIQLEAALGRMTARWDRERENRNVLLAKLGVGVARGEDS